MKTTFTKPIPKSYKVGLQILVSIAALVYIVYKIFNTPFTLKNLFPFFKIDTVMIICLLTIFNWLFEVLKWKTVISTTQAIPLKKAAYETFTAYTYGLISPLNSGNYLKKTLFYPKIDPKKIVWFNAAKGIYQMLITLLFGLWGLNHISISYILSTKHLMLLFSFILLLITIFLFFRIKIKKAIDLLSTKVHFQLFMYSIIKYLCFSILIWWLLKIQSHQHLTIYAGVAVIYLLSSLLPVFNLFDFAIKGTVALWILVPLGIDESHILISYFILWLANHALPGCIGAILPIFIRK